MHVKNSFRMFKARGQPGCWYGYAEIDGVTYKIDAKHVGERQNKHFEGTVKRHLKADQQPLPLGHRTPAPMHTGDPCIECGAKPDFDDDIPF